MTSSRLGRLGTLAFVLASLATAGMARAADSIVGTWKLVKYENTDVAGKVTKPFGEHPKGYFVYDATGHLSVHIMRDPATPPFAAGADDKGTDAEVRAAYDGYVGYFGTYRVNAEKTVVTHVVEGALRPSYTGTDQPRPFKLKGDTLILLSPASPAGEHYYRELRRVR
jgi:hypothetical protein